MERQGNHQALEMKMRYKEVIFIIDFSAALIIMSGHCRSCRLLYTLLPIKSTDGQMSKKKANIESFTD